MAQRFQLLFLSGRDCSVSFLAKELLGVHDDADTFACYAGVEDKAIAPQVGRVLDELGIKSASNDGYLLSDLQRQTFDLIITLDSRADKHCRFRENGDTEGQAAGNTLLIGLPAFLHWPVGDFPPSEKGAPTVDDFRRLRERLQRHLDVLYDEGYLALLGSQRRQYLQLIDALGDGIVIHDKARRIYVFNHAAERITGFKRADVLGQDCHIIFGPDGICGGQCVFKDDQSCLSIDREYQINFITAAGDHKLLRMSATPIAKGKSMPGGVLISVRDITEINGLRWQLKEKHSFHGMIGVSAAMQDVFQTIRQVVASDYPVLITGESGTGKELVANAIHNESRRSGGPFVPVNCGALPENILESELFGHVRGAFTGAIRDKKGRFELADGGTLFLDEIGELTPAFQVKLLRVLEEKRFERVGGEQPIDVDVRIISATNRNLRELIKKGDFREDLFYRLAVVPIELPPLRQRREDIPPLVEHVLQSLRQETDKKDLTVSDKTINQLLYYDWPGNVRELFNALRFSTVRCTGKNILPRHLPPEIQRAEGRNLPPVPTRITTTHRAPSSHNKRIKLDKDAVRRAIAKAGGNKVRAAKILGVGRATLYRFLGRNPNGE